jgi:hypothetical protein
MGVGWVVIPGGPPPNRRIPIANSRFNPPPVAPASAGS